MQIFGVEAQNLLFHEIYKTYIKLPFDYSFYLWAKNHSEVLNSLFFFMQTFNNEIHNSVAFFGG